MVKFNVNEVRSAGIASTSPPFYNGLNEMCFQLNIYFEDNNFAVALHRYRGKYDHPTDEIVVTNPYEFVVHIFGITGKQKVFMFSDYEYRLLQHQPINTRV